MTVSGTVTEFRFNNPHAILKFDVVAANGGKQQWNSQLEGMREFSGSVLAVSFETKASRSSALDAGAEQDGENFRYPSTGLLYSRRRSNALSLISSGITYAGASGVAVGVTREAPKRKRCSGEAQSQSFEVAPSLHTRRRGRRLGGGRVDAADLKSAGRKAVPVQIRARAPTVRRWVAITGERAEWARWECLACRCRRAGAARCVFAKPRTDPSRAASPGASPRWEWLRTGWPSSFLLQAMSFSSCFAAWTGAQYLRAPCHYRDTLHTSS